MKTNGDGWALLSDGDALKVSGDEFYRDATGKITLPLGTIAMHEKYPPEGYLLGDAETYVSHVVVDDGKPSGADNVPFDYTSDPPVEHQNIAISVIDETPVRGDADLTKRDMDLWGLLHHPMAGDEYDLNDWEFPEGNATFEGAVFEIVNENDSVVVSPVDGHEVRKGEVVCSIVTDEDGYASTSRGDLNGWSKPDGWHGALVYGDYSVREVVAPKGYLANPSWRGHVSISADGVTYRISE